MALLLLLLAPSLAPAAVGYPVTDTTFYGGASSFNATITPGNSSVVGPPLRLLTNATYTGASVDVTGVPNTTAANEFRTSSGDFNSGAERTHLSVAFGTMSLATTAAVSLFNAPNNFGNGSHNGTTVAGGRLVLSGASPGTYTTATIDALGAPWGMIFADGRALPPSTITFNLLDVNDTVVVSALQSGQRIPLALDAYPSLKVQVVLATSIPAVQPQVTSFGIGQRAADFMVGPAVPHSGIAVENRGDTIRTLPAPATLTKDAGNPLLNTQASTYYSTYLSQPFVLPVNGSYWMYFAAGTIASHQGAGIARATSNDLQTWTIDAAPLLTPTAASYDAFSMTHPLVIADPLGSGYIMYYTAWTTAFDSTLARATSPDGTTWTKSGSVLAPTATTWDSVSVGMPARVSYDSITTTWTLWYSGSDTATGGGWELGIATSSDGISWTKGGSNPIMARGGTNDLNDAQGGKITQLGGTMYYYYSCHTTVYSICLATSANGVAWSKIGLVINRSVAGWDSNYVSDAHAVIAANGTLSVFYAAFDATTSRIGRTTAPFQAGEWSGRFELLAAPTPDWVTFSKDAGNPVIPVASSTYYSAYLSQPQVLQTGSTWTMYLSAGQGPGYAGANIARATSNDLISWTMDAAALLRPNASTYDAGGLLHPYVVENPFAPGYLMYYTAVSATGLLSIALATSPDTLQWTKVGAVLNGSGIGWDASQVGATAFVRYNTSADQLQMWYAGYDAAGGVSTGVANSTNGVTWARQTGQPVLARGGAGSADQDMAQGGKIIDMRGTLVFYYTCKGSSSEINTCMAQSLDGGFSFAKRGAILNASISGFDSNYAADPAAVLTDDALLLFYAGWDGSTSQIGLAVGAFDPSAPNAWLGAPQQLPRFISGFAANVTAGAGTTLTLQVRSSQDGLVWSNYETVSAADTMVFTQVRRFMEYRATFSGGTGPSLFRSAQFNLTSNFESGRYRSDLMTFNAPVDRVQVDPSTSGFGRLDWYVEAGPLGPVPTAPNDWVSVTGGGVNLIVRIDFWGASRESPVVNSFRLRVESDGVPADVALRVGTASSPRLVAPGPLTGTTRFILPTADFAAAISAALFVNPAALHTDIRLNITSSHFGAIRLSNFTLDYTLKNPIAATYGPPGTIATARENETSWFSVNASTCCGSTIGYEWFIDGVPQSPADPTNLSWTPTFDNAGAHSVTLRMDNGQTVVTHTWAVTVLPTNRAPVVTAAFPANDPVVSYKASPAFGIEVFDPDNDAITFAWAVDGVAWDATSNETTLIGFTAGTHTVVAMVLDGGLNATYTWTLTLSDLPPDATYTPSTPAVLSHRASLNFAVAAVDPDGDPVSYRWTVAGVVRPEGTPSIAVANPPAGSFTVSVTVRGGAATVTHDWAVTSTDAAPTATFTPTTSLSVSHGQHVEFSAEGIDADGDPIAYSWAVDGVPVTAALGPTYTLSLPSVGTHEVSVTLLAGVLSLTHTWTLTSTNIAPSITSSTPSGGAGQGTGAAQAFSVAATDEDGDTLAYAWTLNGVAQTGSGSTFSTAGGLAEGNYAVVVTVSDGHGGTEASTWTFVVPPGGGGGTTIGGGLEIILLVVVAAGAVGALLLMKMRKKKGGEETPPQ